MTSDIEASKVQDIIDMIESDFPDTPRLKWVQDTLDHLQRSRLDALGVRMESTQDTLDTLEHCFDDRAKIAENAYSMAEWFLRTGKLYTRSTKDHEPIWNYAEDLGIWVNDYSDTVAQDVKRVARQYGKKHLAAETVYHIRTQAYDKSVVLGAVVPDKIVVSNGVLDIMTGELTEFEPDQYHIIALPVVYDPEATCPNFSRFLEQVVPNDVDRLALEEHLGYCLVGDYRFSQFVVMVGGGRNGKSTFLDAVEFFLGKKNVVNETLQSLAHNKFSRVRLHGKLANICADIPSTPLEYTGIIKTLTGDDTMSARALYQPAIEFKNRAKLWFSCNQVPIARDNTDAFYSRTRIIDFPIQFQEGAEGTANKTDLIASITTPEELSGVLNLALEGWQRYNSQGKMTGTKSIEENALDYIKRSDPIQYFCDRYLSQDLINPGSLDLRQFIEHETLYSAYCNMVYKMNMGKKPTSSQWFSKRLKRLAPYADQDKDPDRGKRTRVWYGVLFDEVKYNEEWGL